MKLVICPDAAAARAVAARVIARQIRRKPSSVLGLATGRTMEAIYQLLVREHVELGLDFSEVTTFNLDEYVGLPGSHEQSYRHYMRAHLFDRVNIRSEHAHVPDGAAASPDVEALAYEAAIVSSGGIDLQLLGLGENGHIGFNEPLSALRSRTRAVTLDRATREQNAGMFGGDPDSVPARALTMGTGTILDARETLMVVTGAAKADILARVVEGPVSAFVPGSALQLHERCLVVLDEAAASGLTQRDVIAWQMSHDPELTALLEAVQG
ncbi:6-phosphogluconolactonase [Acetobacter nitrogenifigens DSM 23921 = NBRC 105050]|uniref:Glucosamine-6-phosphate deaminase n=1 Tax=Acetobacter nitrogenifigens DSM 23921 = NBRC 105050 TaxID=1120919 RepID=A0A511XBP5_9PROT|nr:glucosamine-6-phosphate deaminase [Acetobacter nitrogenifigens]GBQ88377.1 6-phosphogluconolactonase [Acetobacter nitrogenifigens DSM 23921 = NBRC 105050]GEN60384.1 glucosamine-6-phosphate deaminase [Acetobacter nitrogenifigens DSM 23921 = NBRC 105050]